MADQKAFDASKTSDPADNLELLLGTSTTKIVNITLTNFYAKLMTKLGFLKISNKLSEYSGNTSSQTTVQTNLNVPSKSNVIEKNSTVAYTPTQQYHPVNLKVIQDKLPARGEYHWGNVGDQVTWETISIGKTLSSANYDVMVNFIFNDTYGICPPVVRNKTTTTFEVSLVKVAGGGGDIYLNWVIISQ